MPGHRYGLIGRNGKGKSTLLKYLAARRVLGLDPTVTVHYVSQEVALTEAQESYKPRELVLEADVERRVLLEEAARVAAECDAFAGGDDRAKGSDAAGVTFEALARRRAECDERLLAINVHAVNFELGLDSFSAQFRALGAVLDLHRGPVILAGDLNTWNGGRQALVERFTREHGLASVAFQPDLRTRAFGRALDHIYVRGLASTGARVIPVSSSDHNPLRVRLALN